MKAFSSVLIRIKPLRLIPCRTLSTESPKPFNDVPGLKALPVIGTIHHFLPGIGSIGAQSNVTGIFRVLNEKFGQLVKWEGSFGRETTVVFFDPKDYEKVHRAEESNPVRPGFQAFEYYRKVLNKDKFDGVPGLSTAQGPEWREFRTKVNPALLKVKLDRLYAAELGEIAEDSITRLLKMAPEVLTEDFDAEIVKWSLESIALISLGTRIGCLADHGDDHPSRRLLTCAKEIPDLGFKIEFSPAVWKKDKSDTPDFKKVLEVLETQFGVTEALIKEAKMKIQDRGHSIPREEQSILERLLSLDDKVAVMMANEMIMAGIDTVSFTLTALLYQLAVHQEAQETVRQEFLHQNSSRFFKACLKESLRLSSVVPSNARLTTKEHIVGGYIIPKGVFAMSANEVLSTQEKHYVRAKEFLPERWLVGKTHPLYHGNTHPMVTLPFGFGVRACIGRRIAELEVEIFVKKLLERTKVTWTGPPIQSRTKLMNTFVKPFNFRFEPIN